MNKTLILIKDILSEYNKQKCDAKDALRIIRTLLPAPKPKTPPQIARKLLCLINSCAEGYNGTWEPTGEGNEGFQYMHQDALDIAKHFKVNVKGYKELN